MLLPEAPIQEVTGRANSKIYRKRQSEILPDFIIGMQKKINVQFYEGTVLSLHNIMGV